MSSFRELQRRADEMRQRLKVFAELDSDIVENIVQYSKNLLKPGVHEIDENIFMAQMIEQFEITSHFMLAQMFDSLKKREKLTINKLDNLNDSNMLFEDYCKLICVFLSDNLDIKIDLVFNVYDTNKDGFLSKLEIYLLLKPCVLHSDDMDLEEATKDLIDIVLTVVDFDNNGLIDVEEFRTLVKRNILYIDLLGQVLPRDHAVKKFLQKIKGKSPLQVDAYFHGERERSLADPTLPQGTPLYPIHLELP